MVNVLSETELFLDWLERIGEIRNNPDSKIPKTFFGHTSKIIEAMLSPQYSFLRELVNLSSTRVLNSLEWYFQQEDSLTKMEYQVENKVDSVSYSEVIEDIENNFIPDNLEEDDDYEEKDDFDKFTFSQTSGKKNLHIEIEDEEEEALEDIPKSSRHRSQTITDMNIEINDQINDEVNIEGQQLNFSDHFYWRNHLEVDDEEINMDDILN